MATYPGLLRRTWRMAPWQRNPLFHRDHRIESLVRLALVIGLMLSLLVCVVVCRSVYDVKSRERAAETTHTVRAVLDGDPFGQSARSAIALAPAHWIADGTTHSAVLAVAIGERRGDTVLVEVGATGNVARNDVRPLSTALGVAGSLLAGLTATVTALWLAAGGICRARRRAEWGQRWAMLADEPRWNRL